LKTSHLFQGSKVIKWKKLTKEQRFKNELEYALPNIDRSTLRNNSSNQVDLDPSKI